MKKEDGFKAKLERLYRSKRKPKVIRTSNYQMILLSLLVAVMVIIPAINAVYYGNYATKAKLELDETAITLEEVKGESEKKTVEIEMLQKELKSSQSAQKGLRSSTETLKNSNAILKDENQKLRDRVIQLETEKALQ